MLLSLVLCCFTSFLTAIWALFLIWWPALRLHFLLELLCKKFLQHEIVGPVLCFCHQFYSAVLQGEPCFELLAQKWDQNASMILVFLGFSDRWWWRRWWSGDRCVWFQQQGFTGSVLWAGGEQRLHENDSSQSGFSAHTHLTLLYYRLLLSEGHTHNITHTSVVHAFASPV